MLKLFRFLFNTLFQSAERATYQALRDGTASGAERFANDLSNGLIEVSWETEARPLFQMEAAPPNCFAVPTKTDVARMSKPELIQVVNRLGLKVDVEATNKVMKEEILSQLLK